MGSWNSTYTQQNQMWLGPQPRPRATHWLPLVFVLTAIAAESTRTASTATTEHLLLACTHRMHYATTLNDVITPNWELRKSGHFFGYGMLGLLTTQCWMRRLAARTRPLRNTALVQAATVGIFCAATVASLDEWHQSFLPGRSSSIHDVALDTLGALTCILLYLVGSAWHRRHA